MDNFTHSLVGLLVAEGVHQVQLRRQQKHQTTWSSGHRNVLYWVSVWANNLPDLDFLWTGITGGRLGYLVHHRGHTHTLGGILLQLPILMGLFYLVGFKWKDFRIPFSKDPFAKLFWAVGALGLCLHVFLDSWNSYGVHPFWPISSKWFYGDAVFIFEPWIWLIAICGIWFAIRTTFFKWVLGGLVLLSMFVVWKIALFDWKLSLAYTASFPLILWIFSSIKRGGLRIAVAGSLVGGLVIGLLTLSQEIRSELSRDTASPTESAADLPTEIPNKVVDVILSAMPSNPICWLVQKTETTTDGLGYFFKRGVVSIAPNIISAKKCAVLQPEEITAPRKLLGIEEDLRMVGDRPRWQAYWFDEYEGSLSSLRVLSKDDCHTQAYLRFSRAPVVFDIDDRRVFVDYRYDREKKYDFAEYDVSPKDPCPRFVPKWDFPTLKTLLRD